MPSSEPRQVASWSAACGEAACRLALQEVLGPAGSTLLDSFEGLAAGREEVDGAWVMAWQSDTTSPIYFNNCKAEEEEAAAAMKLSGATSFSLEKGWFKDTLPGYKPPREIAILQLTAICTTRPASVWRICIRMSRRVDESSSTTTTTGTDVALAVNQYVAGIASTNTVARIREYHDKIAYLESLVTQLPQLTGRPGIANEFAPYRSGADNQETTAIGAVAIRKNHTISDARTLERNLRFS